MNQPKQTRVTAEALLAELEKVREQKGEEAFQTARRGFALDLVLKANGETFIKHAFPDLDLDELRAEALKRTADAEQALAGGSPEEVMRNMLSQQMPNLKTQGHYTTFMQAFEVLRKVLNSYFGGDVETADKAREGLDKMLDMAKRIPEASEQIKEIPEDQRSDQAKEFFEPVKDLDPHEFDNQRRMLAELSAISTGPELKTWYAANSKNLDGIVEKRIRDELFDAIRKKRIKFEAAEAN